jgi:2-polyprenyl-3-methyl-5-hydroxy-6-metoxy-1,4-benzoquinol methylase
MAVNPDKLSAFMGKAVGDIGAALSANMVLLGDKLGLYKAMAKAYPRSTFIGFDYHKPSILTARKRAKEAGLKNVTFAAAQSTNYPGKEYDLVAHFDSLHEMGDPISAAKHVKKTLTQNGTWMIVEPFANDCVEDNLNPVGRVFYAASTMICYLLPWHPMVQPSAPKLGKRGCEMWS